MSFSNENLNEIAVAHRKILSAYEEMRVAYVVNSPVETALSVLYKQMAENEKLKFEIFST